MPTPQQTTDAALLAALFDAAVDAIIVADQDGRMVRVSHAAGTLFGYEPEEMAGQSLNMLMSDYWAPIHNKFARRHRETGEKSIIGVGREVEGRRKDGTSVPLHLSVGETERDGQILYIGILHDLTKRKFAEKALERSQRMDAIGQMTGGVCHDFNNLLTVIIGNLELLERELLTGPEQELLHDALEAAELGADLTTRLLAFARKGELSPMRLNVNTTIEQTEALLRRTLDARIDLQTDLEEDIWDVLADHGQLQAALLNLALNAQDAMPKGGNLVIEAANTRIDDAYIAQETDIMIGDYVRVSMVDTGHGMTPDQQKRAFEPFFTTKSGSKGTGLGLSTIYGFVKQSGGYVTIYSEPGLGTTISMYFPVAEPADAAGDPPSQAVSGALPEGDGQRVLVVEDDPAVRRLAVSRLQALGYTVLSAESADEAYDMLQDRKFTLDLLFSDLVMPGRLSGQDLARLVRQERPQTGILLASGFSDEHNQEPALAQSGFELLRKPYRQAELARRLARILSDRKARPG